MSQWSNTARLIWTGKGENVTDPELAVSFVTLLITFAMMAASLTREDLHAKCSRWNAEADRRWDAQMDEWRRNHASGKDHGPPPPPPPHLEAR